MRNSFKAISMALIALPTLIFAATPSSKTVMDTAFAKAAKEKKNVFVIFHASWCGWCKKLDSLLESPKFKSTFEQNYVIVHLDVMEQPAKKDLENAGGEEYMSSLGGKDAGLPFYAFLSPTGKKLRDSILPKTKNIGYPGEPFEVTGFMDILHQTAPRMTDEQRSSLETYLKTQKL